MPQVTITRAALHELRERMARGHLNDSEIWLMGHSEPVSWADRGFADSLEESWLLEKLYGPLPRWSVLLMPPVQDHLRDPRFPKPFRVENVEGIPVVLWSRTDHRLRVELVDDAIRVFELSGQEDR
jgi:hypothetical protein